MTTDSATTILLRPGADAWEPWKGQGSGPWTRGSEEVSREVSALAIPVHALCAIPMRVSSSDPEVVEGLVRVQLETRGLTLEDPVQTMVTYRKVATLGEQEQILAVALLEPDFAVDDTRPLAFDVSPAFLSPPKDAIVLWKELGRWVVLFTRGTEIAYFQNLSQPELNGSACEEIRVMHEGLRFQSYINPLTEVVAGEPVSGELREQLETVLGLPVHVQTEIGLRRPKEVSKLVPATIAQRRLAQRVRRRFILGAGAVLGLYVLIMGGWLLQLAGKESQVATLSQEIRQIEALASQVREARFQVDQLGPAIDYESFPLELFHRCVELLPDEGIRLTQFKVTPGRVEMRGEASDFTTAITWKATLRGSDTFGAYRWDFPQPEILADQRAIFNASGTLPEYAP